MPGQDAGGLANRASSTSLRTRLTTAVVEAGSTLGIGYAIWLLVNYSVARHSLLALPKFDPVDVHCLLSLAYSRRPLTR